jgi:acetyltransferase-like isoleucine patch superfamily enzyme
VLNAHLTLYDGYRGLVSFGRRVAVSTGVTIVAASGPNNSRLAELPYVRDRLIREDPVRIGDDVWLGTQCVILPGIAVGEWSVVGAGAVVTTDVPPYAVVAGVPARVVRRLT